MTDTRAVPTPGDIAGAGGAARLTTAPTPDHQTPAPGRPGAPLYSRREWERAVMASRLHFTVRLVALTLAHHAGGGRLPAGGVQHSGRLSERTGLSPDRVRQCLRDLERAGFLSRPPSAGWEPRDRPRPITLTLPAAGGARTEPPHTSEAS